MMNDGSKVARAAETPRKVWTMRKLTASPRLTMLTWRSPDPLQPLKGWAAGMVVSRYALGERLDGGIRGFSGYGWKCSLRESQALPEQWFRLTGRGGGPTIRRSRPRGVTRR